ncbi:O-antigen ligase family protein [Sphingobacterium sp. DN00404]|uniref:O-antigen ligase family protein n=1 Tax=Sphingobacterium micropteri TaxID=2763501 RepID=A0ABR7YPI6_9SPHI|nr:O-antigen ligase family protein [Sphingobacterium micropteri]
MQSRSFIIGFFVGLVFFIFLTAQEKKQLKGWHYVLTAVTMLSILLVLTLLLKTGSTYGRLFIYKVSFPMFSEHWLHGMGLGNFRSQYLLYQAAYFAEGKQTQEEMLLADNTYYVFNDYWQFLIEGGITAVFVLLFAMFGLGYLFLSNRRKYLRGMPNMLMLAWSLLMGLLLVAFFTHVWEKTLYRLSIVGLIAIILYFSFIWGEKVSRKSFLLGVASIFALVLFLADIDKLLYHQAYSTWRKAERYCFSGYMQEGLELFDEVYSPLKHDVLYLTMYAYQHKKNENFEQASILFREAAAIRPSNELYRQLGICYDKLGDYEKAENNFLLAVNMVPN